MTELKISAPAAHWRRRTRSTPLPQDQAARQGNITRLAFLLLGKDAAIAFLNTDRPDLGGRPLAVATSDAAGAERVQTLLRDLAVSQGDGAQTVAPA